jgi:aldehyde:ferredoxin oxidoreductase
MNAYAGKVLHVNLTSGQVRSEVLDEKSLSLYLGGVGLGVNLLMEYSKPGRDAFDADNPLIYCVGPFSGTLGPAGHGYAVVSKSPLTGGVCEGQVQGFFGSELRRAGYVAVVIKGKASDLSYLWIDDDRVQIVDAQRFRGVGVREVERRLCDELGDFSVCVSGIGEAGEKLCRVATIISDKYHAVNRGVGLGAVMGSKNLKAIVVRGTHDVNVADMDSFANFIKVLYERDRALDLGNGSSSLLFRRLLELNSFSALATRNWNNSVFDGTKKFVGDYLSDRFITKPVGCAACGVSCNSVVLCSAGVFKDEIALLKSDCLLSLGPLCGIDRLDAIVKAASLINEYGMDPVSVGTIVAFAMDLYERGLITREQTGGVDLQFGNVDALLDLICKIGKTADGLGKVLAEGVVKAAEALGGEAVKYACHVKGLELPSYDLRALKNAALGFSIAFNGDAIMRNGAELLDITGKSDRYKIESDIGNRLVEESYRYNVLDSLLICKLNPQVYSWKDLTDYYLFATGNKVSEEELKLVGKRVETLVRLFNILEGRGTRNYDDLPYKIKNCPISDEVPEKGMVVSDDELQSGIDSYYVASGWTADGIPTVDCLKQIGLGHLTYISENAIKAAHSREEN